MSVNKVILVGNVGRDPEVRYLDGNAAQGGQQTKVATFTLATSERYRDRSGEMRENTEWHNIVAWRQSADVAERFIKKGTQLYVEGRLRTRSYTDQSGQKKYQTEIVVDNLQLLGRREGGEQGGGFAPQQGGFQGGAQGGYQQQPAYRQAAPAQPAYAAPQPSYQAPQSAAPAPQAAPAPIDLGINDGGDDLPF